MEYRELIYLDNAATSYPKPPEVYSEMLRSVMQYGGNPGRGSHSLSVAAAEKVYECRALAADMFGITEPERVFFTLNTTHGLNTVIKGVLQKGDHVLLSDMEHNAVYRPIYKLAQKGIISYSLFGVTENGRAKDTNKICSDIIGKLRKNTRMVICSHSSNICSLTLPIKEIGELCRRCGVLFVVDGAQSAGHEWISVDKMKIDALCVPGHKGLYGPQGSGMVILGKNISLDTLTEGGNGVNSLEGDMPSFSPERYEAGTLPTPAIAGLCEGLKFVKNIGIERINEAEKRLYRAVRDDLTGCEGVRIYMPEGEGATLLFNVEGVGCEKVGRLLNEAGICVRSGYHCSALGHRTLGTEKSGAVRVSFGVFNGYGDAERLCEKVREITRMKERD